MPQLNAFLGAWQGGQVLNEIKPFVELRLDYFMFET
jgi:hypothetical protein